MMLAAVLVFFRRWWPFLLIGALVLALGAWYAHWLRGHDAAIRREQQLQARDAVIASRADTAAQRTTERRVDSVTVTGSSPR